MNENYLNYFLHSIWTGKYNIITLGIAFFLKRKITYNIFYNIIQIELSVKIELKTFHKLGIGNTTKTRIPCSSP